MSRFTPRQPEKKMHGPKLAFSEQLHAAKYRGDGEDFREAMNRVANALKDDEEHYKKLREILLEMRFLPAGRIQASMGSIRATTPYNCFVSGTIADSFIEGDGSIMARATEAAATMRLGGGIGYDFSTLRPRGSLIRKLQSQSSGPISFMEIYDAVCRCVASSGHRRGAQMGVLRVDHPDIEQFIHAKQNENSLNGFNISIAITDAFMACLESGEPFPLVWGGEVYKEVNAAALWEMIMRSAWDWAEPGVIFIDTINKMNNLWYCEEIAATNPCGEQPLPPNGACLLGSFNLPRYLSKLGGRYHFDWDRFHDDIHVVVRAMDNVIDRAVYPLVAQRFEAEQKRRMGLGVTGLANCIEALGYAYGTPSFLNEQGHILERLTREAYLASVQLAKEKGPFPLFEPVQYGESNFVKMLPLDIQKAIHDHGIRNSHLTSIAPTGTISLCADNVSSGIEPVFAYEFERTVQAFEGPTVETVTDYGVHTLEHHGKTTKDVTIEEHLAVLSLASRYADSAVSKTCNVPKSVTWEQFKNVYILAWKLGCKGCTTFRMGGKRNGILSVSEEDTQPTAEDLVGTSHPPEPTAACYIDEQTGRRECE